MEGAQQAATYYKANQKWEEAGNAYLRAQECAAKLKCEWGHPTRVGLNRVVLMLLMDSLNGPDGFPLIPGYGVSQPRHSVAPDLMGKGVLEFVIVVRLAGALWIAQATSRTRR